MAFGGEVPKQLSVTGRGVGVSTNRWLMAAFGGHGPMPTAFDIDHQLALRKGCGNQSLIRIHTVQFQNLFTPLIQVCDLTGRPHLGAVSVTRRVAAARLDDRG